MDICSRKTRYSRTFMSPKLWLCMNESRPDLGYVLDAYDTLYRCWKYCGLLVEYKLLMSLDKG